MCGRFAVGADGAFSMLDRDAAMTQSAKAQEPSMDEILASIRRIIADDETKFKRADPVNRPPTAAMQSVTPLPAPVRASTPLPSDDIDAPVGKPDEMETEDTASDVLDLTEAMTAPATREQPPVFRTIEGGSDVFFSAQSASNAPEASPPRIDEDHRPFTRGAAERPLISSSTSAAVDAAFNTLAQSLLTQNARTLDDVVKEMMRPLLKAWLDDNLPSLVERLVRAEIERVSRGRS
jgi:cell pole-organizing protein PopZ